MDMWAATAPHYNTPDPGSLKNIRMLSASILEEVTADSGYCSEKNLLYLKRNEISSYIKLQDHEKRKTRAYSEDISKYYNMRTGIFEDEQFYICHDGRELRHLRTERAKSRMDIHRPLRYMVVQTAADVNIKRVVCIGMMRKKDAEKNKVMKINEQWEELKERSHANIQSERGILKRQTRSIQTEGHFGDIKENENFRRFNYRSADKVYKEFMLYAIGRNINKYHRFLYEKLRKFEGKLPRKKNAAEKKSKQGFLRPKTESIYQNKKYPEQVAEPESSVTVRIFLFGAVSSKKRYLPTQLLYLFTYLSFR